MGTIRTLVLSGGGGRGAFHAGVYRYLSLLKKQGVDEEHNCPWTPDIVVGTSIGAVNGAAIVQGHSATELEMFWRSLREKDIQGLPPTMSPLSRWMANQMLKGMIGVTLPTVSSGEATSYPPDDNWLLPKLGKWANRWFGRWNSLLDTGPLRKTLIERLHLDEGLIAQSERTLLINATNVSTGELATFSNKLIRSRSTGEARPGVMPGITISRILASCSIPLVYPWTRDEESQSVYWDGAVVANTPLGAAMDAAGDRSPDDIMEVVVVLMTPWRTNQRLTPLEEQLLPRDFNEAITWVLDWALLATFRDRVELIHAYNRLARWGRQLGDPELSSYREVKLVIVAPEDFFPAERILDYDERSDYLIRVGYQAAEKAFCENFPDFSNQDQTTEQRTKNGVSGIRL